LPLIEAYILCRHLGWSWQEYQGTPKAVRRLFLQYLRWESRATAAKNEQK